MTSETGREELSEDIERIAIIGLAGRFPGARNVTKFWENLRNGVESIRAFTDQELRARGVSESDIVDPTYVKAGSVLEDVDLFDNEFFGMSPQEARITDPQQRLFLESAWEALEDAGYVAERFDGAIGIYAGAGMNDYVFRLHRDPSEPVSSYQQMIGNDKDFLATRIAYKLNLRGQSITVQTACSTSLVAVHLAAQSLLTYQCDLALAGGVSIGLPQGTGYATREGMISSPDGHCRAFDVDARGVVSGRGLGLVVLKRLSEAIDDGDHIWAVIRGTAINNDGSAKVGYTAPGVDGQTEVITAALAMAEVDPQSIDYVEAHGTGTPLGDPIEIAALTKAFRAATDRTGFCAVGSVKTNVGHLDAAAGVTGLIKTALSLEHEEIPPSLNFRSPNPELHLESSPFFINEHLRPWPRRKAPRRAGVSSFGIGGTNAHVVVEEAPAAPTRSREAKSPHLIPLSARTPEALQRTTENLRGWVRLHPDAVVGDVAFTLQEGRKHFGYRRFVVCNEVEDAVENLGAKESDRMITGAPVASEPPICFLFSGQGSQYVNMGRGLYDSLDVFRETVDFCAASLQPVLGVDIRALLYPLSSDADAANERVKQTAIAQPALFVVEYALAKQWTAWGIKPSALSGHSIGEYTAACVAGVLSLEDALRLVAARGRLMQSVAPGSMLAVPMSESELKPQLTAYALSLAAVNGPRSCVVSGATDSVTWFLHELREHKVDAHLLHTSHAFHSAMMDSVIDEFISEARGVVLHAPDIPIISNVTGTWMTDEQALAPAYWGRHLRETVRFADGTVQLLADSSRTFVEVGPGRTLVSLARQNRTAKDRLLVTSLPHPDDEADDVESLLRSVGRLWVAGVEFDWRAVRSTSRPRRVSLPTYPFDRRRFWVDETSRDAKEATRANREKQPDIDDWFYAPSWRQEPWLAPVEEHDKTGTLLVFATGREGESAVTVRARSVFGRVCVVYAGSKFRRDERESFTIDPASPSDYQLLVAALVEDDLVPSCVAHFWTTASIFDPAATQQAQEHVDPIQERGFLSLVYLVQALDHHRVASDLTISCVTSRMLQVYDSDPVIPAKATVLGVCKSIPQEHQNVTCQVIDLLPEEWSRWTQERLARFVAELARPSEPGAVVAYRGHRRWVQCYSSLPLKAGAKVPAALRQRGVYVITGGLGGVGFAVGEFLARRVAARLILIGRSELPDRFEWESRMASPTGDATAQRIQRLLRLEELGAEVLQIRADVANLQDLQAALDRAESQFGGINGVVHAAGIVPESGGHAIGQLTAEVARGLFRPKVEGLIHLEQALERRRVDFCVVTSSLASVLGGIGLGAYSAANCFMDAFVDRHNQSSKTPWVSINWDAWQLGDETNSRDGMTRVEAVETFERVLTSLDLPRVIISTRSLYDQQEKWVRMRGNQFRGTESPVDGDTSSANPDGSSGSEVAFKATGAPRSNTERILARVWQELLGVDEIGVFDNFFDLGGDSLIGINLVARAAEAGVRATFKQLLNHPTIAGLAAVAQVADLVAVPTEEQRPELGNVPLLPCFSRFLSRDAPDVHHWNVSVLLHAPGELDLQRLGQAAQHLVSHHDSLRLRFSPGDSGWRQWLTDPDGTEPIQSHDFAGCAREEQFARLDRVAAELSSGFVLATGPLIRFAHFDLGNQGHRLYLVAHHFVAEGFSLGLLLEDLEGAYLQLMRGEAVDLPARATSVKQWAESQEHRARSIEVRAHLPYLRSLPWIDICRLPTDHAGGPTALRNAAARQVSVRLSAADTARLLAIPSKSNYSPEEVLMYVLSRVLFEWTGGSTIMFTRIGHGRSSHSPDLDVSRTTGFFIDYTPVVISDSDSGLQGLVASIRVAIEAGENYDLLRFMSEDEETSGELRRWPHGEVSFNYRGRVGQILAADSLFTIAPEDLGRHEHSPKGLRHYPLSVVADIKGTELEIRFVYSHEIHRGETIQRLADLFVEEFRSMSRSLLPAAVKDISESSLGPTSAE